MGAMPVVASVVEGQGEVSALPELMRRVAREQFATEIDCQKPHRVPRDRMVDGNTFLAEAVRLQSGRIAAVGGTVIILADSDDDDPEMLRSDLQRTADAVAPDAVVAVVAVREFEAWFLAGVESLRGHRDVRDDASYPGNPEAKRGCKEALAGLMHSTYSPIRHQVAFAARVDLQLIADRSESFRDLVAAIEKAILRSH